MTYFCPNEACAGTALVHTHDDNYGPHTNGPGDWCEDHKCPKCHGHWTHSLPEMRRGEAPGRWRDIDCRRDDSDRALLTKERDESHEAACYLREQVDKLAVALRDRDALVKQLAESLDEAPFDLREQVTALTKERDAANQERAKTINELQKSRELCDDFETRLNIRREADDSRRPDPPCPQCQAGRCVPCQVAELPDGILPQNENSKKLIAALREHDFPMPDHWAGLPVLQFKSDGTVLWGDKHLGQNWLGDILGTLAHHYGVKPEAKRAEFGSVRRPQPPATGTWRST